MSASMIGMRGRLQKEGEVIHIICDRIVDHDAMLRSIAQGEVSIAPGRGDGARNGGGPDSRDAPLRIRSEEHTSELQSLMRISYAVYCLKNNNTQNEQVRTSATVNT